MTGYKLTDWTADVAKMWQTSGENRPPDAGKIRRLLAMQKGVGLNP